MAQSKIITAILEFTRGVNKVRLNPTGGELLIQIWNDPVWDTTWSFAEPGNVNNEFRLIADANQFKVQQIKTGGIGWGGVEGVDFVTVGFWDRLGTLEDIDGNIYSTVIIGGQEWTTENLKAITYSDGEPVTNLPDPIDFEADITGAYCWYDNLIANKNVHGALYNWYAASSGHGLAPLPADGWRIPTLQDWLILINTIGGYNSGGKLKKTGFLPYWDVPNDGATDQYGFRGTGAGNRFIDSHDGGGYASTGIFGDFLSIDADVDDALSIWLRSDETSINPGSFAKSCGQSVRCVRNLGGAFITEWTFSEETVFKIPIEIGYCYDFYIDWDDGSPVEHKVFLQDADPIVEHTYAAGTYQQSITGSCPRWNCTNFSHYSKAENLIKVIQWGNIGLSRMNSMFRQAGYLESIPNTPLPLAVGEISLADIFYENASLVSIPSNLFDNYGSEITTFEDCFYGCDVLTGDAPALWLRIPEPTGTLCFYGCLLLDNYDDIPLDWKELA